MEWLFDEDSRELFGEIETVNPAMLERLMDVSPFLCALFCECAGRCRYPCRSFRVVLWWRPLESAWPAHQPPANLGTCRPRRTPPDQPVRPFPLTDSLWSVWSHLQTLAGLTPAL